MTTTPLRVLDGLRPAMMVERVEPDTSDDPRAWAERAIDALFHPASFVQPLSLEVRFACVDPAFPFPRAADPAPPTPGLLLVQEDRPEGVDASNVYVGARRIEVPRLDAQTALSLVGPPLRQPCPEGRRVVTWTELLVTAAQVRLPAPVASALSGEEIVLHDRGGIATTPLSRRGGELWVAGPRRAGLLYAPAELHIENDAGLLTLTLFTSWSLWLDDGPGHRDRRALEQRLTAAGWRRRGEPPVEP